MRTACFGGCAFLLLICAYAQADPPAVEYVFPSGGQRGTTVELRVGGYFLHDGCPFEMRGPGVDTSPRIERTETVWFEGPLIFQPASQRKEDYPKDYRGSVKIAGDAPLGMRYWHVSTSQGVTASKKFVVGRLPEIVEQEIDGEPIPTRVKLPVTINGRIFPREDVDVWTFDAKAGQLITCEVNAARIGSALDSRLEIRDPSGKQIAENIDAFGADSFLRFETPTDGVYEVRIHDVSFGGLQHYVYRLTLTAGPYLDAMYPLGGRRGSTVSFELSGAHMPKQPVAVSLPAGDREQFVYRASVDDQTTNPFLLELSDLPEHLEAEPNDQPKAAKKAALPAVLNGRISRPGDVDFWTFEAKKGEQLLFDLRASRLGSPLDSVLTLLDSTGKTLQTSDDLARGQIDSQLKVRIPADGDYVIRVEDRFSSRGDSRFAYRLYATAQTESPDFQLTLPADAITVERGKETKLKLNITRLGGFKDKIDLEITGLPEGVSVTGTEIKQGKSNTQLVFKVTETAKVTLAKLTVNGKAAIGEQQVTRRAAVAVRRGEPKIDVLLLAVAVPTPFKFVGEYESPYASLGSVHVRHYKLERGGFNGPLEISLADRQARHLQGVTGPKIVVAPDANEFDYPITLSPRMEVGRTSRTCVMVVGVVEDADGTKHKVCYSSTQQNDQIIVLSDPGRLSVNSQRNSIPARAGQSVRIPVRVGRGKELTGPVSVQLVVPSHIRGVSCETVTIPSGKTNGELTIQFGRKGLGPFNMPLGIRATLIDARGYPVTADTSLTVVPMD